MPPGYGALMKGFLAPLQEPIYLSFVRKLMKGLLELSRLNGSVVVLLIELAVLSHIVQLWSPSHGMQFFSHKVLFNFHEYAPRVQGET